MPVITLIYDPDRRNLTFFRDGRIIGGMSGQIAEDRYLAIKNEIECSDIIKLTQNGHKAKTPEV